MSPSARSTRHLKELGWHVANVEKYIAAIRQRKDAYGWGDLLICNPTLGQIALVQVTSGSNLAARLKKAKGIGSLVAWLTAGGRLFAHGWAKQGPRGQAKHWTLREVELTVKDLVHEEQVAS